MIIKKNEYNNTENATKMVIVLVVAAAILSSVSIYTFNNNKRCLLDIIYTLAPYSKLVLRRSSSTAGLASICPLEHPYMTKQNYVPRGSQHSLLVITAWSQFVPMSLQSTFLNLVRKNDYEYIIKTDKLFTTILKDTFTITLDLSQKHVMPIWKHITT